MKFLSSNEIDLKVGDKVSVGADPQLYKIVCLANYGKHTVAYLDMGLSASASYPTRSLFCPCPRVGRVFKSDKYQKLTIVDLLFYSGRVWVFYEAFDGKVNKQFARPINDWNDSGVVAIKKAKLEGDKNETTV